MRILSIIDSYKGSLTSIELGRMTTETFINRGHTANYIPISDGGEGFLDAIEYVKKTRKVYLPMYDANRVLKTIYYLLDEEKVAYIELSKICGIEGLEDSNLNPYKNTSYGLGQVIKNALGKKVTKIVIGLGGSAVNDAGVGMLEAVGIKFFGLDKKKIEKLSNEDLPKINRIKIKDGLKEIPIVMVADVKNPLLGDNGATYVYAKQKGAKDSDLEVLEANISHFVDITKNELGTNYSKKASSGAAGGIGYALMSYFTSEVSSGVNFFLDLMDFDSLVSTFDYVITGEGKLDEQSLSGKVVFEVSKRCKDKKVIILCGINELSDEILTKKKIHQVFSIVPNIKSMEESLSNPKESFEELLNKVRLT